MKRLVEKYPNGVENQETIENSVDSIDGKIAVHIEIE